MESKQKYLYLIIGVVILVIYGIVVLFSLFGKTKTPTNNAVFPSPTPIQTAQNQTKPAVAYNVNATRKLEQLLKQRNLLSSADQTLRKQIVQSVNNKTAILQQTPTYTLRYIQPFDLFQAEINTIDVAKAKTAVATYFSNKGISNKGVCYLPLTFFLSKQASQQLAGKNFSFSPIPEGC